VDALNVKYTEMMNSMKVIYPGSFDPITNGHIDVIRRAMGLFDHVVVAVAHNPRKTCLFSQDERVKLICHSLFDTKLDDPYKVSVGLFEGLLTDYAKSQKSSVIVRGLRAVADFEFEFQFAMANRDMSPGLEFVHLMTGKDHLYTSSSLVREVALFGGDVSKLVPATVVEALKIKFEQ